MVAAEEVGEQGPQVTVGGPRAGTDGSTLRGRCTAQPPQPGSTTRSNRPGRPEAYTVLEQSPSLTVYLYISSLEPWASSRASLLRR